MKVKEELKKSKEALLIVPSYLIALVVCFYFMLWLWDEVCGGGFGCLAGIFFIPSTTAMLSVPVGFFIYFILKKLPKVIKNILTIVGIIIFVVLILLTLISAVTNYI